MSRQSSQIEMIGGKSPRQRIWEAIRKLNGKGKTFTQSLIEKQANADVSIIKDYFSALSKAGFITVLDQEHVNGICIRNIYQLIKDNGVEAPRVDKKGNLITEGTYAERMWGTMRRLFIGQDFNYRELAANASTPTSTCSEIAAKSYVLLLARAGYLEITSRGKAGEKPALTRYRLLRQMNTGVRAPMIQRTKLVFDQNLGKVIWQEPAGEQDE
ncbi:hypothetical protein [Undibacterium sp. TC9W]|uniref:hypothetical protein n=1 Tax=Undibacterium sp. TC9W TaxID=3413053 RepID=UPI003BF281FB